MCPVVGAREGFQEMMLFLMEVRDQIESMIKEKGGSHRYDMVEITVLWDRKDGVGEN